MNFLNMNEHFLLQIIAALLVGQPAAKAFVLPPSDNTFDTTSLRVTGIGADINGFGEGPNGYKLKRKFTSKPNLGFQRNFGPPSSKLFDLHLPKYSPKQGINLTKASKEFGGNFVDVASSSSYAKELLFSNDLPTLKKNTDPVPVFDAATMSRSLGGSFSDLASTNTLAKDLLLSKNLPTLVNDNDAPKRNFVARNVVVKKTSKNPISKKVSSGARKVSSTRVSPDKVLASLTSNIAIKNASNNFVVKGTSYGTRKVASAKVTPDKMLANFVDSLKK